MKLRTHTIMKRRLMISGVICIVVIAMCCWRYFVWVSHRRTHPSTAIIAQPVFKRGMPKNQLEQLYHEAVKRDPWFEYKMPISFYGKVVDETGSPLSGVRCKYEWSDLSKRGASHSEANSDAHGLLSLVGVRGKNLSVWMSKDGYYTPRRTNQYRFEYGQYFDRNFYEADAGKPVIFVLHKKGTAEPLVHRKLEVQLTHDGVPVRIDLLGGQVSAGGQFEIQMWKSGRDEHGNFEWRVLSRVQAGGIVEVKEEFPFTAPDRGYEKEIEVKESLDLGRNWEPSIKTQYYVKLGDPPQYARIKAHILGTSRWVFIECWVNPGGSRNLEYDPGKDVTEQFNK